MSESVFIEEAKRLVKEAEEEGILLRIMGALGIYIHSPKFADLHHKLQRLEEGQFTDIDFVSRSEYGHKIRDFFTKRGYTYRNMFMILHGSSRHIYYGQAIPTVDIFFDKLNMCHDIDYRNRLRVDYPTTSLADLLLQKLQIVQITMKDVKDVIVLLRAHDVEEKDEECVNCGYISELLRKDWGFFYTATRNLKYIRDSSLSSLKQLSEDDINDITTKINKLLDVIEKKPKSLGWKLRSKIGTRRKWYNEVGKHELS